MYTWLWPTLCFGVVIVLGVVVYVKRAEIKAWIKRQLKGLLEK